MPLPVYDLLFGASNAALTERPQLAESDAVPRLARPEASLAGWCGGEAPAIDVDAWPRSPVTGFPMVHLLTLELPPDYRRRGPQLVALALFQADDHIAIATPGAAELLEGRAPTDAEAAQPFYADLARACAHRHPTATPLVDLIGGHFTLLWLSEAELRGPRVAPPPDRRAGVIAHEVRQNLNAWDHTLPPVDIYLSARPFDPNAGIAPTSEVDDGDGDGDGDGDVDGDRNGNDHGNGDDPSSEANGYVDVVPSDDPKLKAFFEEVYGRSHLGGTCFSIQDMPAGLTPYFLELEDGVGGANFGGGNMQLDLESGVFDWACG